MTQPSTSAQTLGIVVIGRNEGARLVRCFESLRHLEATVVYVDSGSTDGSVAVAESAGAQVVALDLSTPFTAARARNAGMARLGLVPDPDAPRPDDVPAFIQFIDGDCEMDAGWFEAGLSFLNDHPDVAVVSGRLRERYPDASAYNALCDKEWNTPVGEADACGGIAMMRSDALAQTSLFDPEMIAGEEPELCLRLKRAGWKIWRIAPEMALHDAAMTRFGQFWKRMRRGGFAYALWANMHGSAPERLGIGAVRRTLLWGFVIPVVIVLAILMFGPIAILLWLIYPAQIVRLAKRAGGSPSDWRNAALLTVGKFAETLGIFEFHWRKLFAKPAKLIEHR